MPEQIRRRPVLVTVSVELFDNSALPLALARPPHHDLLPHKAGLQLLQHSSKGAASLVFAFCSLQS